MDGNGGRMLFWYCQGCDEAHAVTLDYPMLDLPEWLR